MDDTELIIVWSEDARPMASPSTTEASPSVDPAKNNDAPLAQDDKETVIIDSEDAIPMASPPPPPPPLLRQGRAGIRRRITVKC